MSRLVYIGGFLESKTCVKCVGEAFGQFGYDDVEPFTMQQSDEEHRRLRLAGRGGVAATHSAGALSLNGLGIKGAHLFAPPSPVPVSSFPLRTAQKTILSLQHCDAPERRQAVIEYYRTSAAEAATHLLSYLQQLPAISRYDRVATASAMQQAGVDVHVAAMTDDRFFPYSDGEKQRAARHDLDFVVLEGQHDELEFNPEGVLTSYFAKIRQ